MDLFSNINLRDLFNNFVGYMGLDDPLYIVRAFLDIGIVTWVVYKLIVLVRETRAWQLIKGLLLIIVATEMSGFLELKTINFMLRSILSVLAIGAIVLFQPELRRALEKIGRSRFKDLLNFDEASNIRVQTTAVIEEIIKTCTYLSSKYIGALIVIERDVKIGEIINSGIELDSQVSSELLINIFTPDTPLHDGAVVIRDNKIKAAACLLPLTDNPSLSKELGMRHRSALGITEVSDCIAVVVSEESGKISFALNGGLTRNLTSDTLRKALNRNLLPEREANPKKTDIVEGQNQVKIGNWFKKDIKIKILAFLIALLFWLYVSNVTNPFKTVTVYNVPVTEVNRDYLDQNNYRLRGTPRTFIDITIRGRSGVVDKIRSTDFDVFLDYSQIKSVSDRKLAVSEPVCLFKNVTVESYTPKEIDVQLYREKLKYFKVDLISSITMKPGYVLLSASVLDNSEMPVYMEEAIIDNIGSIKAFLELTDVDRDIVQQVQCRVFDKKGNEIPGLGKEMKVNVRVETAKEVLVSLVTRGRLAANHIEIAGNRVIEPYRVLLKGAPEVLENLKEIKTEQLDIDGLDKDLNTTIPLVIPEGTELVNSPEEIRVSIDVEKLAVRGFEFTKDEISILNAKNDGSLIYEIITDKALVQFRGLQSELNNIVPSSLRPAVDVADLGEGTHQLQLNMNLPESGSLVQRVYVEVRISKTPETPPEDDPTDEEPADENPPENP